MAPSNWDSIFNNNHNDFDGLQNDVMHVYNDVQYDLSNQFPRDMSSSFGNGYSVTYSTSTSSTSFVNPVFVIVGVVVGVVLLFMLIVVCCCCCKRTTRGRVLLAPQAEENSTTPAQAPYNMHEQHNPLVYTHSAPVAAVAVYPVPPPPGMMAGGAPGPYPLYPSMAPIQMEPVTTFPSEYPPAYDSALLLPAAMGDSK